MHVARKRFGQHFLQDKQVIQSIIDAIAPQPGQHLVEIGPGQGALTLPLLKKTGQLEVIELDRDLILPLKARCAEKGELIIYQADALKFDFNQLIKDSRALRLVGNLPYNISTPLIFHLLQYAAHIHDMHFMLQKEVVDRMAARTGTPAYGRLSIMVQYHCRVVSLFNVTPHAFNPPPQVESSIVKLVPHREFPYQAVDFAHFAYLVKTAFSHRRKTLRNSLRNVITDENWENVQIDSQLRPEQLSLGEYVKLSNSLVNSDGNLRDR
ncbi:MAG TPA: 16S rRNA (adenine(1518)-N(6)/adenine(1519)-N(6))-dimethyltransferase RsmA [Gammaproteobacteria bacterium]|nr:16S rRNA (adenine(1518)-N(6)/adenine(1519)-N(6))-dimethyltransferase RsmA [Gammaproteobacteria bacterium]